MSLTTILSTETVLQRLQGNTPLSLIRYGDGESLVLNATSSLQAMDECNERVIKRQTGYLMTNDDIRTIRANLLAAYTNADIIGIPMHKQMANLSDTWKQAVDVLKENVPNRTDEVCSMDIGYDLLKIDGFTKLCKGRTRLHYIGCRQLQERMQAAWGCKVVNGYHIAPEAKFTSGYDGDVHYPTQFNRAQRWMDVVNPGRDLDLLLVGAGVIGKIYCNWWRDRGGVAFDVGSILDEFAGFVTRGPERGMDKVLDDGKGYKL